MPKSENQKLKLLYILKILTESGDESHLFSAQELIDRLSQYDISADRKTIYRDIEDLRTFGYDIVLVKGKGNHGYFLASRDFEVAELKVLVDAVQASRFITLKKSQELIQKITMLASKSDAAQLNREIYVLNRIKTDNESIYYNVDDIHKAIQNNVMISFQYFEYTIDKKLQLRKNGERYYVSPWALIWNDENYYLIAYDRESESVRHYRVDKMKNIALTEETRFLGESYAKFDTATYTNKMFGMFGGETELVNIRFDNQLIGVVLDRFGKEIDIHKRSESTFSVRVNVVMSGQFFGWITGLGRQAEIIGPKEVRKKYKKYLADVFKLYD